MADGTTLNPGTGGDTLATEDMVVGDARLAPGLPTTEYKIPRSKIVVGDLDTDRGDVTQERPLPVESLQSVRYAEIAEIHAIDIQRSDLQTRASERGHQRFGQPLFGRTGRNGRT